MSALPPGVTTVGGLLPTDTLVKVMNGSKDLAGTKPSDYGALGESVNEAAESAWTCLRGRWRRFHAELDKLPEGDPAVGVTREYWLGRLFHELGFGRVPVTPTGGLVSDDGQKRFPISHRWENVPIHQLGWGVRLGTRTEGVPGAATSSPQSLVQEYLNRSASDLWAILANGRRLRILRDSSALAGAAYIEFDLEAIFDGELTSSFILLFRLAHASRFERSAPDAPPTSCWLEKWRVDATESGIRILKQLRTSVKEAIETLGSGFLRHPDNRELRAAFNDPGNKEITPATLRRALLRAVYRLLFLFVIEDRHLLLPDEADAKAKERYLTYFASARLRRVAALRHGGLHADQWQAISLVLDGLGCESGLLEYVPRRDDGTGAFVLVKLGGNERKKTSSYYTPSSLLDRLLDSTLEPVIDDAVKSGRTKEEQEKALLAVTVCDPACGSGHFLVAAARRIAKRLAFVRTGDPEPDDEAIRTALREVIGRCVYGVDLNPMAVELAKVSLWLEAMEPVRRSASWTPMSRSETRSSGPPRHSSVRAFPTSPSTPSKATT